MCGIYSHLGAPAIIKEGANCSDIMKGRVRLCRSMSTHSSVILAVSLHSAYLFIRGRSALQCTLHLFSPSVLDITYPTQYLHKCKHYRVNISDTFSIVCFVSIPKKALISQIKHYQSGSFRQKAPSCKVFVLSLVQVSKCARPSVCTRDCNNFCLI